MRLRYVVHALREHVHARLERRHVQGLEHPDAADDSLRSVRRRRRRARHGGEAVSARRILIAPARVLVGVVAPVPPVRRGVAVEGEAFAAVVEGEAFAAVGAQRAGREPGLGFRCCDGRASTPLRRRRPRRVEHGGGVGEDLILAAPLVAVTVTVTAFRPALAHGVLQSRHALLLRGALLPAANGTQAESRV